MWRVLFFVLFCCFCFALESKVDSTKNIESKSQDLQKLQDSINITESKTQDSIQMTESKIQDSINSKDSKQNIQFNPKSKTPRFPLLDKKEKNKLLHTDYADSPKVFVAPKPLEHLSMSPFEEWRGSYVMYMYNFSPMDNPLYRRDEMKFQLSFRVPLVRDIFRSGGVLYFAFTDTFFFQVFNDAASSPVRDNDFQPEILYTYPMNVEFWGGALSGELEEAQSSLDSKYLRFIQLSEKLEA